MHQVDRQPFKSFNHYLFFASRFASSLNEDDDAEEGQETAE
jgi:hypothetical protein